MSAPSIYTLAQGWADLTAMLERIDEEGLDGDSAAMIGTWLASLEGETKVKLEHVGQFIRMQELDKLATDTEVERLRLRSGALGRRVKRVKEAVLLLLNVASLKRVQTSTFTFEARGNGGKAPLVIDDVDADVVAAEHPDLVVTTTTINHDAVRKHLESGGTLPFARLEARGTHLQVK